MKNEFGTSRREALRTMLMLPAMLAAASGGAASAQTKAPQSAVKYQNEPKGSQKCSGCKFFVAGSSPTTNGTCQVVEGAISPNGWCTSYAPKS
jgi:hypothetical protein